MNTRSSSNTGRACRSLEGAFGPYARGPVHAPKTRDPLGHRVANALSALLLVVLVGAVACGAL